MLLLLGGCHGTSPLPLSDLGGISCDGGYAAGISAPFCGAVSQRVLCAGGANFPDKPASEGGQKVVYSSIFSFDGTGWRQIGELPWPMAYGGSFLLGDTLIAIGGSNGVSSLADVLMLRFKREKLEITQLTSLPHAVEQAGYASRGNVVYVFGGLVNGRPSPDIYCGTYRNGDIDWTLCGTLPEPAVQPVGIATEDGLLFWAGFNPVTSEASGTGWKLDLGTSRIEKAKALPAGMTMTGATSIRIDSDRTAFIGGVDTETFNRGLRARGRDRQKYMEMRPAGYKFRRSILVYNEKTDRWYSSPESEKVALAGASDGRDVYIMGGETKPGIRTSRNWSLPIDQLKNSNLNQNIEW